MQVFNERAVPDIGLKLDIRCLADKRFKYQRFFTAGSFGKSKPNINAKEYHFNLPLDDLLLAGG
jgi:hypothetical protein